MPLQRRLPKRGFRNPFRMEYSIVNLNQLEERFEAGAVVDMDALRAHGLIKGPVRLLKVLASGSITKPLTVKANKFSEAAQKLLEAAGGSIEVI